ncbi:MAG: LON peptidase substrate-binding domain-containing protein [Pseudomonadota bacterium]
MSTTERPLFPLGTVLYPGGHLPLRIFEPRYLEMVSQSMREQSPFVIVPIRSGIEVGQIPDIYQQGVLATIIDWDQGEDGLLAVTIEGSERVAISEPREGERLLMHGTTEPIEESSLDDQVSPANSYLIELLAQLPAVQQSSSEVEQETQSATWLAYRLAEHLPMPLATKYEVLCAGSGANKLDLVSQWVAAMVKEQR